MRFGEELGEPKDLVQFTEPHSDPRESLRILNDHRVSLKNLEEFCKNLTAQESQDRK